MNIDDKVKEIASIAQSSFVKKHPESNGLVTISVQPNSESFMFMIDFHKTRGFNHQSRNWEGSYLYCQVMFQASSIEEGLDKMLEWVKNS